MNADPRALLWAFPDQHGLFVGLDEATRRALESIAQSKAYAPGAVLGHMREVVAGAFLLVEGAVRLETVSPDGVRLVYGSLGPGEVHGLLSTLDGSPSIHFATVIEPATVVLLPRARFRPLVFANPQLCERVVQVVCDRTRTMCLFNDRMAFLRPFERVAQCLASIATGTFTVRALAEPVLDLRINQFELSSMLSLSRSSVNRALRSLQAEGVIRLSYRRVRILDLERLQGFARDGGR